MLCSHQEKKKSHICKLKTDVKSHKYIHGVRIKLCICVYSGPICLSTARWFLVNTMKLPDLYFLRIMYKKNRLFSELILVKQTTLGFCDVKIGADPLYKELVHKFSTALILMQDIICQPLVWRKALVVQYEELQIQSSNGKQKPCHQKKTRIIHQWHTSYRIQEWTQPTFEILMLNTHAQKTHAHTPKSNRT